MNDVGGSNLEAIEIRVNVYDMVNFNRYWHWAGVGIYHSGVEVLDKEYLFGGHMYDRTGVFFTEPRQPIAGTVFRDSIVVGKVSKTRAEIEEIIERISKEFAGNSYNLISRNCNHFSDELCKYLCDNSIPGWINRLAVVAKVTIPCFTKLRWLSPPTELDVKEDDLDEMMITDQATQTSAALNQGLFENSEQVKIISNLPSLLVNYPDQVKHRNEKLEIDTLLSQISDMPQNIPRLKEKSNTVDREVKTSNEPGNRIQQSMLMN